ncbi:MAG: hypothetical protein ACF8MJ_01535 [Phycisphaerales bacterium JB050]
MKHRNTVLAGALLALASAPALAGTVIFNEGDFEAGSWSAMQPFWSSAPDGGEFANVTSDRFSAGNPVNHFMLQQYAMNIPQGVFNVIHAPIVMDGWTHDPATDGTITSIGASVFTFPVALAPDLTSFGGPRLYIMQGGSVYMSTADGTNGWEGFEFDEPAQTRNFSGFTSEDFIEVIPDTGLDLDSHPDFAGDEMQFAFGIQLTSTNQGGLGTVTSAIGWDDLSLRMQVVPAPGAATLLACAGLVGMRRRR